MRVRTETKFRYWNVRRGQPTGSDTDVATRVNDHIMVVNIAYEKTLNKLACRFKVRFFYCKSSMRISVICSL